MSEFHSRFIGHEQGSRATALLFLAVAWAGLAWPWLSGSVTIPWDAKAQFLPQLQFLAQSFAKGESPAWSPYAFSGMPQIADPQSFIFSPPYLLLALVNAAPSAYAADVTLYLFLLVSAAAMFLWLADKGWHHAAALLAALAFAFGAAMAWRVQHIGQVMSLAYLPITLLFLDRALGRTSLLYGIAAGISAALLVLGRDQIALMSVYFLVAYVVAHWWGALDRGTAIRRSLSPLIAASLAGILVVTFPVILTALVAAESNRPSIDIEGAGRGSLHPAHLLTLLAPDVFGAAGRGREHWGPPSMPWGDTGLYLAQNMGQMYLGALPLVLLVWGTMTGLFFQRGARLFMAAFVVSIVYALGWYTPVFQVFHAVVPGVNLYRRPADAVFVIGFLGSVLAGYALHDLLTRHLPRLDNWQKIALIAVPTTGYAIMLWLAWQLGRLEESWLSIAVPAVAVVAGAAFLYAIAGRPMPVKSAMLMIVSFMAVELAYANRPGGATGLPPETYDVLDPASLNPTLALLKQKVHAGASDTRRDRIELVGFGFHWPNSSLTHQLENTLGYNPLRLGAYTRATGAGDTVGLIEQKSFTPLMPSYRSLLADMLGLRYIASSAPVDQFDKALKPGDLQFVAKTADGFIYENPRALPRVLFATEAKSADFEAISKTGAWPQFDPTTSVLLEGQATVPMRQPGSARIIVYSNTRVTIEADSPDGGYVVLNDIWQPWWFATLDGSDTPLLKANVLFRAVAVPPGRHTVTFTFKPLRGALKQLRAGGHK